MGILDEAIKEHLELKRQHGADASELKQLEDEAFGPPERPGSEEAMPDELAEAPTEFMAQPEPAEERAPGRRESVAEIADLQEAPPAEPQEPSEGPSTKEREAIAEQPTELYDVEEELAASVPAPSEEELVEEEIAEPRLAPVEPLPVEQEVEVEEPAEDAGAPAAEEAEEAEEEDDGFFDEQRLSDELDQALETPSEVDDEEHEDWEPEEPRAGGDEPTAHPGSEEDLLEETPDFLEEAPEDDQLWFEQKPPKDFDFDD